MAEKRHRQIVDELRNMNENELNDALQNERRKLYEMRRQNVTKQLENTAAISQSRRQIARILTLKTERSKA